MIVKEIGSRDSGHTFFFWIRFLFCCETKKKRNEETQTKYKLIKNLEKIYK